MSEATAIEDGDLAAALRHLGVVATEIVPVTGLPSEVSDRATYRIRLSDGTTVKARRLTTAAKAKRYAELVRGLPVPAILARRGRFTVEEWVEGRSLTELALSRARLARAADLLGSIHATELPGRGVGSRDSTRPLVARLHEQIDEVAAAGALSRRQGAALRRAIRGSVPAMACSGLTHNDFCAENIVEDGRGRLHAIDNGGLRPGFLDFDLARTRYRWPMPAPSWRTFLACYARWRQPLPTAAEASFWRLAALLASARFRLIRRSPGAEVPLRRLQALLARM